MDAPSHVKPGIRYPATMFTAGIFDSRVEPWDPAKMVAALRVDFDAGRGMGLTKARRSAQLGEPAVRLAP